MHLSAIDEYTQLLVNVINGIGNSYPKHAIVIAGDLNISDVNWNIPRPLHNEKLSTNIITCFLDNAPSQNVLFPTCKSNILDLMLLRNSPGSHSIKPIPLLVKSDHDCGLCVN